MLDLRAQTSDRRRPVSVGEIFFVLVMMGWFVAVVVADGKASSPTIDVEVASAAQ